MTKPKSTPAARQLLRARNEALENHFYGQILQRYLAGLMPWRAMGNEARPTTQFAFHATRKFRYDFAWPIYNLLVDIDGGTWNRGSHGRGSGIEDDREKDAHAVIDGWNVMRFTGKQVKSQKAIEWTEAFLRQKVPGGK